MKDFLFDEITKEFPWDRAWEEVGGTEGIHRRYGDDEREGFLDVIFGNDGDAHVCTNNPSGCLSNGQRFRSYGGGGQSIRVRKALMILALAINAENEEHPQRIY